VFPASDLTPLLPMRNASVVSPGISKYIKDCGMFGRRKYLIFLLRSKHDVAVQCVLKLSATQRAGCQLFGDEKGVVVCFEEDLCCCGLLDCDDC
jgi:hypothetical protein